MKLLKHYFFLKSTKFITLFNYAIIYGQGNCKTFYMKKNSKGFTLTETLLTITIIVILFSLAIPAIFSLQKNLRQKELDDKAQIIYTAVQNRLTELYTSGRSDLYSGDNVYIHSINNIPGDFSSDEIFNENQLLKAFRYVYSFDDLNELFGEDTINSSLKNSHYVIEIIPYTVSRDNDRQLTVPSVYAVYYSEDKIDVANEYNNNSGNYIVNYRIKKNRLNNTDARVGYYGGSNPGSSSDTKALSITSVKIYSEDIVNRAVIKARQAIGVDKNTLTFKFVFFDEHNNSVTYFYYPSSNVLSKLEGDKETAVSSNVSYSLIGLNYTFEFTMDDLSSSSTRFSTLFSSLTAGDDITLVASVSSSDYTVSYSEGQDIGNSIFATKKDIEGLKPGVAYITNPRHLQNLDISSKVDEEYSEAVLLNDIDLSAESDFTTTYTSYFNNLMSVYKINTSSAKVTSINVPCFKGINNSNITSFNGENYKIINLSTKTALFETNNNQLTIKNLTLTGERVYGNGNVGGLVGSNPGTLTIKNVKSYLESNIDYPTSVTSENYLESIRWIYGSNAGGLVGYNLGTLNIESSFVSSVIGSSNNNSSTGGLVGFNSGSITIDKSYADCYLYGKYIGGLIGNANNSNINISNCYTAGFIGVDTNNAEAISAGIVAGDVNSITNSYTIMAFGALDNSRSNTNGMYGLSTGTIDSDKSIHYSSVKNANKYSNLFYKVEYSGHAVGNGIYSSLSNLGDAFSVTGTSTPYKLMGTSLASYNYHKLKGIDHFGDWSTNFISGSLVYYEAYQDASYGFDGAGVDISLNASKTIVGDGYGVAFDNKPTSNFYVNETLYSKDSTYFEVVKNDKTYYIYPLNIETINPTSTISDYYSKVVIRISDIESESKTYYYNPHFARTVVESDDMPSSKPIAISIRSPRHLYNLSLYYDDGYRDILTSVTYKQERNMDYASYDWSTYFSTNKRSAYIINSQNPIGASKDSSFNNTYDGGCYVINNVSFETDGFYVGMFGYNSGIIKNVVIATQYNTTGNTYKVSTSKVAGANTSIYYGILAGFNSGTISNSAIAGYYLSGNDNSIYGYRNSEIFIGGLVGYNSGTINSSSADSPKISLVMNSATCYAGGFVGYNSGFINNSYGINMINSTATDGNTNIAGFAGFNSGSISESYCATALVSSGTGSNPYSFAPNSNGGTAKNCYYLAYGSFQYIDGLYSYNGDSSKSSGIGILYIDLENLSNNKAITSLYNKITLNFDSSNKDYPFKAVVKDNNDNYIHYGEWQTYPVMGNFGLFYWEHEQNGNNDGYHITYLGSLNKTIQYQSTLCTSHDDGGVITEYGYGYYVMNGTDVTNTLTGLTYSENSYNTAAKRDLEQQFKGLLFFPYTTSFNTSNSSYLYLANENTYGTWKITYKETTMEYKINPFFANAFSLTTDSSISGDGSRFLNTTPGLSDNPFEIRSADQLQYINWNSKTNSVDQLVDSYNYTKFNFLMYTKITTTGAQTKSGAGNNDRANLNFKMSHDINADSIDNFTPIAGQNTSTSSENSYNATLYAWFGSLFDGQSYKIQELNINSKSFTVGLFGVTAGAKLENIILYSTKGANIQRETYNSDPMGAYAIGGLCGIAYDYSSSDHSLNIENCAVAGYQIIDNSRNRLGLGEANIGGLVGVSNISIDKCSAVVDIIIKCVHRAADDNFTFARWGNFIRVGGISGAVQYKVTNSYSGGSIKVEQNTFTSSDGNVTVLGNVLNETYNTIYPYSTNYENQVSVNNQSKVGYNVSTNIFLAGIAGSGFAMNYQNFTGNSDLKEGYPTVENCYTYMTFPTYEGTIRSIVMIASVADRYSNGTSPTTIKNCYYLSTSADFEINAPKYYFSNSDKTPYNLIDSYKDSMIKGDVSYLNQIFGSGNSSRVSISTLESKSYEDLSALTGTDSMISKLGGSWNKVTDSENGQAVDGKYSFNGGNSSLTGKNYPFPTIITQSGDINVHYGSWPFKGSYWQKGSDSVDIFDYISDDKYAYVEYKFFNTEDEKLDNIEFTCANEKYCVVDSYSYSEEKDASTGLNYYNVKIKLLKTGSVDIKANWAQNKVANEELFNLNITAKLKVNVSPVTLTLNRDETIKYDIKSTSSSVNKITVSSENGIDYTDKVIYSESHSIIGNDVPFATIDLVDKTSLSITGLGYNGNVRVNADYVYNGVTYSAFGIINVNTGYVVGIKGDSYNETYLDKNNNLVAYYNPGYSSTTGPNNSDSTYFIYERNSENISELIKNVVSEKIKLTDDNDNEINNVQINIGSINTSSITDNTYNTRPITFNYLSFDEDSLSANLNVPLSIIKVNEDDSSYVITNTTLISKVSIKPTHYVLSLNNNESETEGSEFKNIELTKSLFNSGSLDLTNDAYIPTRKGYTFAGWYKTSDCDGQQIASVSFDDVKETTENIIYYAKWIADSKNIEFYDNDSYLGSVNCAYDQSILDLTNISKTREHYTLLGYYDSNSQDANLIVDTYGNIVEKNIYNQMILDQQDTFLYAKWHVNPNLILVVQNKVTKLEKTYNSTINTFTYSLDESNKRIEGWYSDSQFKNKIADENGNILDETGLKFNEDVTLYGKVINTYNITLTINGSQSTSYTLDEGKVTSITSYSKPEFNTVYLFIGWFDDADNEIFDADGNSIDASGYNLSSNIVLHAKFIKYIKVDSFQNNEEYIVVSNDYALTNQAYGTIALSGSIISTKTNNNVDCIDNASSLDESLLLWKTQSSNNAYRLINNKNYLYGYRERGWLSYNYYLTLDSYNSSNWTYSNNRLSTKNGYLNYYDGYFYFDSSSISISLYKKTITSVYYED